MSDTDDTDVLLLIPPDFFLVQTDSDGSVNESLHDHCNLHCGVVDNLIEQLDEIKFRLNTIEHSSEVSLYQSANDSTYPSSEMSGSYYQYTDDFQNQRYVSTSTKSTPQKPRTRLCANSLPATPNEKLPFRRSQRPEHRPVSQLEVHQSCQAHSTQIVQNHNQDRDADESSINTTPEKCRNKAVLGEIDKFLTNIQTIKRISAKKKLENVFHSPDAKQQQNLPISFDNSPLKLSDLKGEGDTKLPDRLELKDVDRLLQEMEKQQQKMEMQKKSVGDGKVVQRKESKTHTWQSGETKNSVPDHQHGMRDIIYAKVDHKKLSDTIQNYITNTAKNTELRTVSSASTNDSTPPTVFEKSSEDTVIKGPGSVSSTVISSQSILNQNSQQSHQLQQRNFYECKQVPNLPTQKIAQNSKIHENSPVPERVAKKLVQNNLQSSASAQATHNNSMLNPPKHLSTNNLFGLADLWNYNQHEERLYANQRDLQTNKLLPKLEEERLRRQHCEKLIQDLQLKLLEMQQRLAVAIQVDCAKDAAILRFHEAWEKVADRWQSLESERNMLALQLNNVQEKTNSDMSEVSQKIGHYESELSRALDLAHSNQEKCNSLEYEKSSLLTELESLKDDLDFSRKKLQSFEDEHRDMTNKMTELENESLMDKNMLVDVQREIQQNRNEITNFKTEFNQLMDEKVKLEREIKEEKDSFDHLENKHKNLEIILENSKKSEKQLQLELKNLREQTERAKMDLRNFYQQQVELLVKDKLKEFQHHLEQAERSLHDELQSREQTIARTAAKQLQKLNEKHVLEVKLIEEKHKEEINLYEIQVNQMKQQITLQQNKLDQYQVKRNNIAQELRGVMEAQWIEALKIINNGKTPSSTPVESKSGTSYFTHNIHSQEFDFKRFLAMKEHVPHEEPEKQRASIVAREQHRTTNDEIKKTMGMVSTPLSSRSQNQREVDLQKYIKMLLDKHPGNPTEKEVKKTTEQYTSDLSDVGTWYQCI